MTVTNKSSKAELLKYVREDLGLNPADDATKEDLLDLIKRSGGQISSAPDSSKSESAGGTNYVRLKIFDKADDPTKQVHICINGENTIIKRNVEVTVSQAVYSMLKNAVYTDIKQGQNGELIETEMQREPFTVIAFDVNPSDYEN
jgi:hypothetical protein